MMKLLNIQLTSGSGKSITPEDKWIYEHSTWTDNEATAATANYVVENDEETDDGDPDETKESKEEVLLSSGALASTFSFLVS